MLAFEDLPQLSDHGFVLIVVLLVVFWVYMKVKLLRERLALRGPDEEPPAAPRWQHALARASWTFPVLGVLALALIGAMLAFGVTA
ncbi:MAG: hypothetical protein QNJ98_11155 [Planctomycetota bacterium]|nr:hypothetical protein [Planctomycetota bacterium]